MKKNPTNLIHTAILGAALLASESSSLAFSIKQDQASGRIILVAPNCPALKAEVASIQKWTESRGEVPASLSIDCDKNPSWVEQDIAPLLPKRVREIYGIYPACGGPNCFNAALLDAKLVKHQRFTHAYEWHTFLSQCSLRPAKMPPQPGDLVAIRERNLQNYFVDIHGFTYVGNLGCSKNGMTPDTACVLEPFEHILRIYDVRQDPKCRNPDPQNIPEDCSVFINYYDCSAVVGNHGSPKKLHDVEERIADCARTGRPANIGEIAELLEVIEFRAQKERSKGDETRATLLSLRSQLPSLNTVPSELKAVHEGEDKDLQDDFGRTPLYKAARQGDGSKIMLLLEKNGNPNLKAKSGDSVLHAAAYSGNVAALTSLLESKKLSLKIDEPNQEGKTPLQVATLNGKLQTVQYLIEQGANIHSRDLKGNTLIHDAAMSGNVVLLKFLAAKGLSLNFKNKAGDTALKLANEYYRKGNAHYLKTQGAK